jgi:hypothetical protein
MLNVRKEQIIYLSVCLSVCLSARPSLCFSVCVCLSVRPSIHPSVYLLDPGRVFRFLIFFSQSVGLLVRGISSSQVRYLHTEQHKHRINVHRHPCVEWDSNLTILVFERSKTVHALDRASAVIGADTRARRGSEQSVRLIAWATSNSFVSLSFARFRFCSERISDERVRFRTSQAQNRRLNKGSTVIFCYLFPSALLISGERGSFVG